MPKKRPPAQPAAKPTTKRPPDKRAIEQYDHKSKTRINNPPVGLVTPKTDPPVLSRKTYAYDPHLDPQLVWAGKAEHTAFEIPTVSLHVHERIDPRTISEAVRKRNGVPRTAGVSPAPFQPSLFETKEENPPLREAVDFYRHPHGWTNRLIAGDSLLVMNSLLEKEGMAGQVQMVYIDPPYGIDYGSNFQPFVNQRNVRGNRDEDLTQEPETVKAFRDTWELGIHSYVNYLRDRLLLARDLLNETGSCFVQISDRNIHIVRNLLDEVFDAKNFIGLIAFKTGSGFVARYIKTTSDYLIWYGKDSTKTKFRRLYTEKSSGADSYFDKIQLPDGSVKDMGDPDEIPTGATPIALRPLVSAYSKNTNYTYRFEGRDFYCGDNRCWKTTPDGMDRLAADNRIVASERTLKFVARFSDLPYSELTHVWEDTMELLAKKFVVQTASKVISRCVLLTTDPGDI